MGATLWAPVLLAAIGLSVHLHFEDDMQGIIAKLGLRAIEGPAGAA